MSALPRTEKERVPRRLPPRVLLLMLVFAVVVAACGGSDTATEPVIDSGAPTTAAAASSNVATTRGGGDASEDAPFPEAVRMPYLDGWTNLSLMAPTENGPAQEVVLVYSIGDKLELISIYTKWAGSALDNAAADFDLDQIAESWEVVGTMVDGGERVKVAITERVDSGTSVSLVFISWDF